MIDRFVFNLPERSGGDSSPSLWLWGAVLLTLGWMVFALVLIGVPGLSRGGIAVTALATVWFVFGLVSGGFRFPLVLALPLSFYVLILLSGMLLPSYPIEYAGQVTTIWLGAILLAVFVANGVSIWVVVFGFAIVVVANGVAWAVGYDGYQVNVAGELGRAKPDADEVRNSMLAGQANVLVSLVFTLPFLLFLPKQRPSVPIFVALIGLCVVTMLLTASRSTVPFTLIFILFGSLFFVRNLFARFSLIVAGIVAGIFFYQYAQNPHIVSRIQYSPAGELYIVKRFIIGLDEIEGSSASTRVDLATEFWPYFNESPIIGYGPRQFQNVVGDGSYAHNNFAEIAINWGAVGLVMYYAMYALVLFGIVQYLPVNYAMIASLSFLAMSDFFFVTFLDRPLVLLLCLLLVYSMRAYVGPAARRARPTRRHHHRARHSSA